MASESSRLLLYVKGRIGSLRGAGGGGRGGGGGAVQHWMVSGRLGHRFLFFCNVYVYVMNMI